MFDAVHKMRTRILTSPFFDSDKVLGAIIFEDTMNRFIDGRPTCRYLWEKKGIVPFLKIDCGLREEKDGIQLMKTIPNLEALLEKASEAAVYGTKARSLIVKLPTDSQERQYINALVTQQFMYARAILNAGLIPIIEPEVSVNMPPEDKAKCEEILCEALVRELDALSAGYEQGGHDILRNFLDFPGGFDSYADMVAWVARNPDIQFLVQNYGEFHANENCPKQVILKVTLPERPNTYQDCFSHPNCIGIVALSGGYSQAQACEKLRQNVGMIASFSRALLEGLKYKMHDEEFNARLVTSINKIYDASCEKEATSSENDNEGQR